MKYCLVLFSLCCIHLSVCGLKLAHSGMEIVQNMDSHCTFCTSNGNQNLGYDDEVEEVHHGRNKRYLLFEKGAAVSVTTAAVKTIVSGVPRGFNIICEESLYYDLPTSFSLPKKDFVKPATRTNITIMRGVTKRRYYDVRQHGIRNNKNYFVRKNNNFENYYSTKYVPRIPRREFRSTDDDGDSRGFFDIEAIFFQQIESFAKRHNFNGRHCIMRTLCECQHFLFPKGQSLFHDVIRLIVQFSWPTIGQNGKYMKAFRTQHSMDCANLYGPHCRISFLGFFTNKIHGDF